MPGNIKLVKVDGFKKTKKNSSQKNTELKQNIQYLKNIIRNSEDNSRNLLGDIENKQEPVILSGNKRSLSDLLSNRSEIDRLIGLRKSKKQAKTYDKPDVIKKEDKKPNEGRKLLDELKNKKESDNELELKEDVERYSQIPIQKEIPLKQKTDKVIKESKIIKHMF